MIELLDVAALLHDLPAYKLRCGEVGTVVEYFAPDVWLVEFSDKARNTPLLNCGPSNLRPEELPHLE